jgi:hypothetical protein
LFFNTELKMDPQVVIDHTHGRRATDNLRDLKPELKDTPEPAMQPHVQEFEEKILASADEFKNEVRSRRQSMAEEIVSIVPLTRPCDSFTDHNDYGLHFVRESLDVLPDVPQESNPDEDLLQALPAVRHQAATLPAERALSQPISPSVWL